MPPKILRAWSYARLSQYRTCPKAYQYKVIEKRPEPPSPAMERGLMIHKTLEGYVKGTLARLPSGLSGLKKQLTLYRKRNAQAELEIAFTDQWKLTGWYGSDVWLRVKMDLLAASNDGYLDVVDYKTGRIKPEEHAEPLELYALATFLRTDLPVPEVRTHAWYVDHEPAPRQLGVYLRKDLKPLQRKWIKESKGCTTAKTFKATPTINGCRWCTFSSKRGGPCTDAIA